ncbi:hypothetical protein [Micromonospora sp. NBC_01813]|uniref:hypothetical protein n=1 Tax=Micromonospora sp. NBC_01813 TaxID=2975988 RepID=UPI002DD9A1E8|nr:hypothetical protein [Micromonospora sp. NBC_01813]WSA06723.1 hypothetical protein OG958_20820 [Micromonospora sp. NBC_01813]
MPSTRGHRRVAVLLSGAAVTGALLLSGCAAGQIAETAVKSSSIGGVNIDAPDGSVSLRNLSVPYPGTEGYPAGGSAVIEVGLYNNTNEPIAIRVSAAAVTDTDQETLVQVESVVLGGSDEAAATPSPEPDPSASPEPDATEAPAADPGREAIIELPANGWALFTPDSPEPLRVTGLAETLAAGYAVNLVFEFSDGSAPLVVPAPVNMPLSPAPRAPGEHDEEEH